MPQQKDMTKSDASRVQSSQAKGGNDMSSTSFAARAQSAGDKHANANNAGNGGSGAFGASNSGGNIGSGAQGQKK